jgi:enolase
MPVIQSLFAHEILDSRGIPTLETIIMLDNGIVVSSAVPSGTSTGSHEAVELRDGDKTRYMGKGVLKAVENVNTLIAPALIGQDPTKQTAIDQILLELDGTQNKSKLGANAILSASQTTSKAGAAAVGLPLYEYFFQKYQLVQEIHIPTPIFNVINGGAHGAGNLDFQEFQIVPASNKPYHTALQMGAELFMSLEQVLISKGAVHSVGIEGGFAPDLYSNTDAFQLLLEAISKTSYILAQDVFLSVDIAANFFHQHVGNKYKIRDRNEPYSSAELIQFYAHLHEQYRLLSIEDGLAEDEWATWKEMTAQLGDKMIIIGDDFLTTNKERVQRAIQEQSCNAILIKPNQIGTISETVEVVKVAKDAGWYVVFSHRSGETTDDFIADMAVGLGADYAKFGAPNRGERVAKYNRLLRIESELLGAKNV